MSNLFATSDSFGSDAFNAILVLAKKQKILTKVEEVDLLKAVSNSGDQSARERLALAHLRMVISCAKRFKGYGLSIADLVAQGNLGLMRAIDKYELGSEARLSTYAEWWVRAEMTNFIIRNISVVRHATTIPQRTLFYKLKKIKQQLGILHDAELSQSEALAIAEATGTTPAQVIESDRRLSHGSDTSLNSPVHSEDREEHIAVLQCPRDNPADALEKSQQEAWQASVLQEALTGLSDRECIIITSRHMADERKTLFELAREFGVSSERIRQIERIAFKKLRHALRSAEGANGMRLLAA